MKAMTYLHAAVVIVLVSCVSSRVSLIATKTAQTSTRVPAAEVPLPLTEDDIKIILDNHNRARKLESAADMTNLTWNSNLALIAQNWTDACNFTHQPPGIRRWGENMAAISNIRPKADNLAAMIKQWVEEKRHNSGGTFEECCSFQSSLCCHYTQVIWARTTNVGCGYSVCGSLTYGSGALNNITFMACYYSPTGNIPKVTYDWHPYLINVSTPTRQTATTRRV